MKPTTQYIYRLQPARVGMVTGDPTEHEIRIIGEHVAYLEQLLADGTLIMAGRSLNNDECTFGIVILIADSEQSALSVMQQDPAVSQGIMTGELFPFHVAFWSSTKSLLDG